MSVRNICNYRLISYPVMYASCMRMCSVCMCVNIAV